MRVLPVLGRECGAKPCVGDVILDIGERSEIRLCVTRRYPYDQCMEAILSGGPADGEVREVGMRPPDHIDVEVTVDLLAEIPESGAYQPSTFEKHRYVLDNVSGDPKAPEPRAKYSWRHRLPNG